MLNQNVSTLNYDNLVNCAGDVGTIKLAAGQGKLLKGSIIDTDGKLLAVRVGATTTTFVKTSDTTYDDTKTYFTESNGAYTKATITVFASGTTYYERVMSTEKAKASYILCEDIQTDETNQTVATVWKNGNFVKNSVVVGKDYILTDADVADLRDVSIIFESAK